MRPLVTDSITEEEITNTIRRISKKRTDNRDIAPVNTIMHADRIYVLERTSGKRVVTRIKKKKVCTMPWRQQIGKKAMAVMDML